jgi:hypothetical protein
MRQLGALSLLMLACAWPVAAADKLPPLDADFLEYLASFGGDEEDWTLFAEDEEPAQQPPAKDTAAKEPAAANKRDGSKQDGSKQEAAAKPAEER